MLESELQSANKEIEEIRDENRKQTQNMQREFEHSLQEMERENESFQNTIRDMETTHKDTLNKIKKEKLKYKKLATMAKMRVGSLSKEISMIKRDHEAEKRAKNFEVSNLTKQMHEIERQRDEIKFRLTMDSFNPVGMTTASMTHASHPMSDTDILTNNVDVILKQLQMESNEMQSNLHTQNNNNNPSN